MMALGEQPYISTSPTPLANGKELELKYDEFRKSVDDKSIHIHLFRAGSFLEAEKGMKAAIHEDLGLGNPERMKKMGIQENKLDDISFNNMKLSDGRSIDKFAVFKTKYGNYSMRAIVDGQQ